MFFIAGEICYLKGFLLFTLLATMQYWTSGFIGIYIRS